ncbi:MAG: SRPBCC family protein [Acidobacteria bacterium]|nr:SRPBCC family protein [Acidobacteriota bacterium]
MPAAATALLGILALLPPPASSPAAAAEQPGVAAGLQPVSVAFTDLGDSTLRLEGRFTTPASRATAWGVLTDYDHIQTFVDSMLASRVKARGDGLLLVEQRSVARVLWFHRTFDVVLKVREEPGRLIAFDDVSKASFERYEGSWSLQDTAAGTEVIYRLTAKGGFIGFMARGPAQKMVKALLEQVRAEIGRRAAARAGCCGPR